MEKTLFVLFATTLLILGSTPAQAQKKKSPSISSPSPAPAPAPHHVNLTDLLSVAGPFHTFLNYLQSTKVLDTYQNQANNTEEGITLFAPRDSAFSSLKNPSLRNLTQDQLKQLCLFHALPHYYSLSDFKSLSQVGSTPTFAGGAFSVNFTDVSGTIHLNTGWTSTKISSSVISTDPVAVYEVDKVLLPEAIFGTDIPPAAAPAPAPETAPSEAPAADSPAALSKNGAKSASASASDSSSYRVGTHGILSHLVLGITSGILALFL